MLRCSFTLRDLFWLALVVGVSVGWWMDRRRSSDGLESMRIKWEDERANVAVYEEAYDDVLVRFESGDIVLFLKNDARWWLQKMPAE
jgi:hypothetical protein